MSKFTKAAIINSFMMLLSEKSFDDISVKDIVNECGINRNTFYYHFSDIYALVDEVLQGEINKIVQDHQPYKSWNEGFLSAADFALKNKKAILHLHHSAQCYQLQKYFQKVVYDVVANFVELEAENIGISDKDKAFVAEFYTFALQGFVNKWLDNGMKDDFEDVLSKASLLFQSNIKQVIDLLNR